jgi:hypothetical protein
MSIQKPADNRRKYEAPRLVRREQLAQILAIVTPT